MIDLDGKKILIWGYGREGKSTEAFLSSHLSADSPKPTIYEGDRAGIDEEAYDVIIKSPGIRMDEDNPKYTSQTELFLQAFRDKVIGITGTKGKSTTSKLMQEVLAACTGRDVILLGNIGKPCLDYYDEITEDTIVVYEMSCHQLAHSHISPHIAVFLNLYEEHLDYYDTLDRYFTAKSHIATYQADSDRFYVGENVPHIDTEAITTIIKPSDVREYNLKLKGEHNRYNAEFVYRVATECYGCDPNAVISALSEVTGLPHRLEYVGARGEVTYYDDSISTIPEAAISALKSIPNACSILIGGMDRGIDYTKLTDYIIKHPEYNYICMYASGRRVYDTGVISDLPNTYYEQDLEAAIKTAERITDRGAIILSPAAASYDHFKNFEERGDCFKKLIMLR
ncbi:MAG: UDP-N-acetylmuramoyl-L-alanine--D-glutamate ligase [Lachnospiraceae bacterium]|nr:UDP-N-acetylmuramoyl-L-alanine--D-glutamate ligase [Lachnospiraceae bacterium]